MKGAAVDCQLNAAQNGEEAPCQPLKGKVGDFMYHPNLDIDIIESASKFGVAAGPRPAAAASSWFGITYKGARYRAVMKADGSGFNLFGDSDEALTTEPLGSAGIKDAKPSKPIVLF